MTRPREVDWREELMERYKRVGNPRLGPLQVKVSLPFLRYLDRAAQTMGVNRSTFIRRACAVQIAHVLHRPVREITAQCPSPKPWGFDKFPGKDIDHGADIEQWCPHPGCDGSHLR
jgi:hypothetical protein